MTDRSPTERSVSRLEQAVRDSESGDIPGGIKAALARLVSPSLASRRRSRPLLPEALAADGRLRFVLGVTTFNRLEYIERLVTTFEATRSNQFQWTLIVADDGSTDGTWEYLMNLGPTGYRLVVIRNQGARVAGQTNSILIASQALGFDLGFKADDDVYFNAHGWDQLYHDATVQSGMDHLVYHNDSWKPGTHSKTSDKVRSVIDAENCMGCFYTFTPRVLERVGLFDEKNFPVRGHSHIDFTVRCCRAGFNDSTTLWDALHSDQFIGMWPRETYNDLTDWSSPEIKRITDPGEKARRLGVIHSEDRMFLSQSEAIPPARRSAIFVRSGDPDDLARLEATGSFIDPSSVNREFDQVFVLNLADDQRKWAATAEQLGRWGIDFERFPAVFGSEPPHVGDWERYEREGLIHPVERRLNRKLIQSPGAWGYLLTMGELLRHAKRSRHRRILIFDDDVRLHRDFGRLFETVISEIPPGFEVLFLGGTQRSWDGVENVSEHLYTLDDKLDGSFAVGLSESVFDDLLERIDEFVWPFDAGPLRQVALEREHSAFVATPSLVIPDVSHSAIREGRDNSELADLARWNLADYRNREAALPRSISSNELISVLVVADDDPRQLIDTIDSIRLQTYGKLEILVGVDDDDSAASAAMLSARSDSRIAVVSTDTEVGRVAMLNQLLSQASGRHISVISPGTIASNTLYARAREVTLQRETSFVTGAIESCGIAPSGLRNRDPDLEEWCERFGTGERRTIAGLVERDVIETYGGVIAEDEAGLLELIRRIEVAGDFRKATLLDGLAGVTTSSRPFTASDDWQEFHRLIQSGKVQPYVRLAGYSDRISLSRAFNSAR